MRTTTAWAAALLGAAIAVACSSSGDSGGTGGSSCGLACLGTGDGGAGGAAGGATAGQAGSSALVCTPGAQVACACPGGPQGAQPCLKDGSGYGACVCPGAGGAGGASGGSAGAAGVSGSGAAAGSSGSPAGGMGGAGAGGGAGGSPAGSGGAPAGAGGSVAGSGGAGAPGGQGGAGTAGAGGAGPPLHVVINEVATAGPGGGDDEYVELYNPTSKDITLTGWTLRYASKTGAGLVTWTSDGVTVAALGSIIIGSSAYAGPKAGTMSLAMSVDGGGLALVNGSNVVVDRVAWNAGNEYAEAAPAPVVDATFSISRIPDGNDTDDNGADFQVGKRTPSAPNAL